MCNIFEKKGAILAMMAIQKIYCTVLHTLFNIVHNIGTTLFADEISTEHMPLPVFVRLHVFLGCRRGAHIKYVKTKLKYCIKDVKRKHTIICIQIFHARGPSSPQSHGFELAWAAAGDLSDFRGKNHLVKFSFRFPGTLSDFA